MKYFLEMIEQVKRQTSIAVPSLNPSEDRRSMIASPTQYYKTDMFFHFAEHCIPFVFSPSGKETSEIPEDEYSGVSLDAPFKIFSVEILGGHITVPDVKEGVVSMLESGDTSWLKEQVYIDCIMVVETKPKDFMCFALFNVNGQRNVAVTPLEPIVHQLLKRLKREATGVEHVRERIKIGSGKDKRIATFRRIVHVKPKKLLLEGIVGSGSRSIDWTHRWAVRGHWRSITGLGKDREGTYCVANMTWVSEHEKGPEDSPLVTKTRLVHDTKDSK